MSIPPGACRAVFNGTLPGGEIFATGFWFLDIAIGSDAAASNVAQEIWNAAIGSNPYSAISITAEAIWGTQTEVTSVTVYAYIAGGPHATYVGNYTPDSGSNGTSSHTLPNQCCSVLTLRTALSGRRYRGRMYLPATGAQVGSDGEMVTTVVNSIAEAWALFFAQVATITGAPAQVISAVGTTATPITAVSMDTRVDIQRRRANRESVDSSITVPV